MPNFKFIKNREKLSDKEVESKTDFNEFIKGYQASGGGLLGALSSVKIVAVIATVAVISGAFYLVKNFTENKNKQAFIKPPLEETRIKPDSYMINTANDTIITYTTGSSIHIPASSFIDANGKDISGEVEIRYREFHNKFDIFLSGIPMHYDSANTHYQLETAGMFECMAYKDNEPIYLKDGKEISVNMVSQTTEDDYNIYYLDTAAQNWQYISPNSKANKTNTPVFDTERIKQYEAETNNNIEPAIPSIAKRTAPNIELDYNKEEFPELAVFDGIKFEIDPSNKNFDPALANKTWEDVTINKSTNNGEYTLTFIKGNESHQFLVSPVLDEKDYEKAQNEYVKKQEEYFSLLEKRKKDEKYRDEVIQSNYNKLADVAKWANVNQRIKEQLGNINYAQLAVRTLRINRLGIWNCDRPYIQYLDKKTGNPDIITKNASFVNEKGNPQELKAVYMIPETRETVYGFPVFDNNKVEKFSFMKNAEYILLVVTKEGYPAYVSKIDFKNAVNGSEEIKFKLTVSNNKFRDINSLKEFLQL